MPPKLSDYRIKGGIDLNNSGRMRIRYTVAGNGQHLPGSQHSSVDWRRKEDCELDLTVHLFERVITGILL